MTQTTTTAIDLVHRQAKDYALWFIPIHITEDVLQKALRELHAVVEQEAAEKTFYGKPPYPGLWHHEEDGTIRAPIVRDE